MGLGYVATLGAPLIDEPFNSAGLPSVPTAGLGEVLASFSGAGGLYAALAELGHDSLGWSAEAIRVRAHRVLLAHLEPLLIRWPKSGVDWIDALPAQSFRRHEASSTPRGRVNWVKTRITGWPPAKYHSVVRERQSDEILASAFIWTVGQIVDIYYDARKAYAEVGRPFWHQLVAAREVLAQLDVEATDTDPPGRPEIASLRASGRPWTALADVAELLIAKRASVDVLARELILPQPEFRGVLFHLGCTGEVLIAFRNCGWETTSVRPIGVGSGPAFSVSKGARTLDLWFETSAAFRYYGGVSPYGEAISPLGDVSRPIGADIGIFDRSHSALLLECKCSNDRTYVFRNGYEQALAYLAECRTSLVDRAEAAVIGPDEVVRAIGSTQTLVGKVSILPASRIKDLVSGWLDDQAESDGQPDADASAG